MTLLLLRGEDAIGVTENGAKIHGPHDPPPNVRIKILSDSDLNRNQNRLSFNANKDGGESVMLLRESRGGWKEITGINQLGPSLGSVEGEQVVMEASDSGNTQRVTDMEGVEKGKVNLDEVMATYFLPMIDESRDDRRLERIDEDRGIDCNDQIFMFSSQRMEDPKQCRPRVKENDLIEIVGQHGGMEKEDSGLGPNVGIEICSFEKHKPPAVGGPRLVWREIGPM
ncbi:hypothetical protein EZV62_019267 [Acer yangbiense]|uniref:Uncharacterized protein n=1 Tax=Acer yangbiense TaxID=1000413 RepID=A0A5C7HAQ4_9ROSI|nr:hypothetical protein EZV62_019267 [Acer yangbiense]